MTSITEELELDKEIQRLRSRLRDLKVLYTSGLASKGDMDSVADDLDYLISQQIERQKEKAEAMPAFKPKNKKTKNDFEQELVKNILSDVLTNRLKCSRSAHEDSYRFELYGMIPRKLIVLGSIEPMIEHLESLKRGLAKMLDDAIVEIRERNGKGDW